MTNHNTPPFDQDSKHPVLREPDALVENIFPLPGTDAMPDLESQDIMGEFLIDRFVPEEGPRTRIVLTPSGHTMPGIIREPAGFKEVPRWRKVNPREWLVTPRQAAAVVIGSLALFNTVGNHATISGGAKYVGHAIYRVFEPVSDQVVTERHTVRTPGQVSKIDVTAASSDQVGSSAVDPAVIRLFVDEVVQAQQRGGNVVGVTVTGNTSDEWLNDSSIGGTDSGNSQLGQERAAAALKELTTDGLAVGASQISLAQQEHVLTAPQKADILAAAQSNGYPSIKAAIEAMDNGRNVSPDLAQKIKQFFTDKQNRGVSLSATVEYPGHDIISTKTTTVTKPGVDHKPAVPKPHFYGFIPLLPIRRRERYDKVKQLHQWHFSPSTEIMRPQIIREDRDQAWVRLRPEAVKEDGSLVDNAWAYVRKYEHLLRDERIVDVLRADFQNAEGTDKCLRVMFVDQTPTPETISAFEALLQKFAAMEEGRLGDRVSGIFVYPSENAGTSHRNPKRIAMGLDKQSSEHVLGTYTYVLDLVELHMPSTWNPEELEALFQQFNGPGWVASHEVAGHGTDETDQPLRLRRVRAWGIPNAHVIDGEPRARKMSRLDNILRKLPSRPVDKTRPIEFDISYPVIDNSGEVVTMQARVNENDPRLAHATESTIVGYQPSRYAGENASEHYAETAASITTGISVPYSEASVSVEQLQADNGQTAVFAEGYHPDKRGQRLFTESVGAASGSFPADFPSAPAVRITRTAPANDPLLSAELARTSRLRSLYPQQMVAVLARIARTIRKVSIINN